MASTFFEFECKPMDFFVSFGQFVMAANGRFHDAQKKLSC